MRGRREREPAKTSNLILVLLGLFLLAFISVMTAIFWVKGAVPDTLIQYTLGTGGVEALLQAAFAVAVLAYLTPKAKAWFTAHTDAAVREDIWKLVRSFARAAE